jgi:hypothetical protein
MPSSPLYSAISALRTCFGLASAPSFCFSSCIIYLSPLPFFLYVLNTLLYSLRYQLRYQLRYLQRSPFPYSCFKVFTCPLTFLPLCSRHFTLFPPLSTPLPNPVPYKGVLNTKASTKAILLILPQLSFTKQSSDLRQFLRYYLLSNSNSTVLTVKHFQVFGQEKETSVKQNDKGTKTTAPRIPMWSPSMVLAERHFA